MNLRSGRGDEDYLPTETILKLLFDSDEIQQTLRLRELDEQVEVTVGCIRAPRHRAEYPQAGDVVLLTKPLDQSLVDRHTNNVFIRPFAVDWHLTAAHAAAVFGRAAADRKTKGTLQRDERSSFRGCVNLDRRRVVVVFVSESALIWRAALRVAAPAASTASWAGDNRASTRILTQ